MANANRGEITKTIGGLEVTVVPNFGRMSRAEAAVNKSCMDIIQSYGERGGSLKLGEIAIFLSQITKPRVDHNEIGKHLSGKGYEQGIELIMLAISSFMDIDADGDDKDENTIPGPDDEDDSGN